MDGSPNAPKIAEWCVVLRNNTPYKTISLRINSQAGFLNIRDASPYLGRSF